MNLHELVRLQNQSADDALRARRRIEKAVDAGELPAWVMEICEALERSSLLYGRVTAHLDLPPAPLTGKPSLH